MVETGRTYHVGCGLLQSTGDIDMTKLFCLAALCILVVGGIVFGAVVAELT